MNRPISQLTLLLRAYCLLIGLVGTVMACAGFEGLLSSIWFEIRAEEWDRSEREFKARLERRKANHFEQTIPPAELGPLEGVEFYREVIGRLFGVHWGKALVFEALFVTS